MPSALKSLFSFLTTLTIESSTFKSNFILPSFLIPNSLVEPGYRWEGDPPQKKALRCLYKIFPRIQENLEVGFCQGRAGVRTDGFWI